VAHAPLLAKRAVQTQLRGGKCSVRSEWVFDRAGGVCILRIDGKGHGVVASRAFAAGERIVAEEPLAIVHAPTPPRGHEETVGRLEPAAQAAFWELSQADKYGEVKTARGVWLSNAYPMDSNGQKMSAVYALICRINHACRPNAHIATSRSLARKTVHAVRSIRAGEELTVTYLNAGLPRAERRAALASKFCFACSCALCGLQGAELAASDGRQRRLGAIEATLGGVDDVYGGLEALVEERGRLLAAEGMPREWAFHDMFRAFMYCHKHDEPVRADRWLGRALAAATTILGHDSKVVAEFRSIAGMRGAGAGA